MGETGCGKTRLVKFMCQLQCPTGEDEKNLIIMKVHFKPIYEQRKGEKESNKNNQRIAFEIGKLDRIQIA